MYEDTVRFYGSEEELEDLRVFLFENGICHYEDTSLEAAAASTATLQFIEYVLVFVLAPCVVKYLDVRGKRMVSKDGDKVKITGYSAKDAGHLLKTHSKFQIESDKRKW